MARARPLPTEPELRAETLRVIERVRAVVRLVYPDEMLPTAKRIFDEVLDDEEARILEREK